MDFCNEYNCYSFSGNILIHFKLVNLNLVNSMMEEKMLIPFALVLGALQSQHDVYITGRGEEPIIGYLVK